MLAPERSRVLNDHFKQQNAKWRRQHELNEATWRGFLMEAGFLNPQKRSELSLDAQQFLGSITKQHNDWAQFYVERKKRLDKFYKDSRNQPPQVANSLWKEFQNDLAAIYDTYAAKELDGIRPMGQIFLRIWDEQYGGQGREAVAFWWRGVYETTQKRQEMMKDIRAWERGETPSSQRVRAVTSGFNPYTERHKAWQPFVEKVYLPTLSYPKGVFYHHTPQYNQQIVWLFQNGAEVF